MSSSRLTRKVTVEVPKKITDTSAPRKSVFDRLGPGAVERSQSRRDDFGEPVEKCRHWLKDGHCPFGSKCRYDHGIAAEAKSKLKIIRSIVSKSDEPVEKKSVVRLKRFPDEDPSEHKSKRSTKPMKAESVKVTKESLREELKGFKEHRREEVESKIPNKRKEVAVRKSTSSSGWNLHDNSDTDEGNDGKQLDWEVRGAMHHAREVALEERRNDLRKAIAKMDEHVAPIVTISNVHLREDSPPFQEEDAKPEKKKKSKSDKSKKKMKKKSHKSDVHRVQSEGFLAGGEFAEKLKKAKSSSGKKKKKQDSRDDSDREMMQADGPYRKDEFEQERFEREYYEPKKKHDDFHSPVQIAQTSKSRLGHDSRPKKHLVPFEVEAATHHFDKRSRSPHVHSEARHSPFEREHRPPQFEREPRGSQHERESRQSEMDRESQQLEKEARQYETHHAHLEREARKTQFERESRQARPEKDARQFEKGTRQSQFERDSKPPSFDRKSRQPAFERESRPGPFERDVLQMPSEKGKRPYYERAPRSPPFERRSTSPPFVKETRPAQPEWDTRPPRVESRSPVMEKRHRQPHVDQPRIEEELPHTHTRDHRTREKQKPSKAIVDERAAVNERSAVSERVKESKNKEEKVKKKVSPQRSLSREKQQAVERKESVKEERKTKSKAAESAQKEVKQKAKKIEEPREVAAAGPAEQAPEQTKPQKNKPAPDERKKKGPRTPSPEIKQSTALEREPEPASGPDKTAEVSQKRDKEDTRQKSLQADVAKEAKSSKKEKAVSKQKEHASMSESSDSDSSSSSDESESEGVESVSGDEKKGDSAGGQKVEHEKKEEKKETVRKEQKREGRHEKKPGVSHDHSEPTEGTKERAGNDAKGKHVPEERDRHGEERKERASDKERAADYDRREDKDERHNREHVRDHRKPRDEEAERRLDSRAAKDVRDMRERDARDHRDYREFPRVDYRDRERFREYDERDRHHPFDMRRDYREGPPEFGRGGWGRDMRGRDGYDAYDGRGQEYDERRGDSRGIPGDYDRHYDRDRPHPDRGGRFREMEERHEGSWHERKGERGYREPERERYHEGRERFQDDGKTSRGKRSRASPEPSRGDRKGHNKERKRGSGSPPAESEEWDYEEGHSPAADAKNQQIPSRKRPKEASPPRSPRSDSAKRKKASSPESKPPESTAKSSEVVEKKETTSKEDDKDSKKSKKDKGKKTKKRKLSEEETGTTEGAGTPEHKRARESEPSAKDKQAKKAKPKEQSDPAKKSASDGESDSKGRKTEVADTKTSETLPKEDTKTEKESGEQVFSDWSDASAEGSAANKTNGDPKPEEKQETSEVKVNNDETKAGELDGSFEDVYDPISDDELEAIIADEDKAEGKVKEKVQTLDIEDVDWSILGSSTSEKVSEPGDYIKRFSAGNIFSRIGISSSLAGPVLTKKVQEKCAQNAPGEEMKDLLLASGQRKLTIGALVAAEARKLKERANVVNDIGPCRRALCARRDFHIRKQLRRLTTTKLGSKLLLDNTAVEPVDSQLFAMSVSIFRRGMADVKDEPHTQSPTQPETSQVVVC